MALTSTERKYRYERKHNPHFGNKINTKKQCKDKLNELLLQHPQGLTNKQLMELILPYKGHLAITNYRLGNLLKQLPVYQPTKGLWVHLSFSQDITTETWEGGVACEKNTPLTSSSTHETMEGK